MFCNIYLRQVSHGKRKPAAMSGLPPAATRASTACCLVTPKLIRDWMYSSGNWGWAGRAGVAAAGAGRGCAAAGCEGI